MIVVNRKARAIWAAKHFIIKLLYAYSWQKKAPTVLQVYAHAQIINAYIHKGKSRDSGQGVLMKRVPNFTLHPMEIRAGKR